MTKEQVVKFLEGASWKFAKTMAQHPHSYTLREWHDDDLFIEVVKYLRVNSYESNFFKMKIKYWSYDGYKYWTMGYGLEQTKLINRAKLDKWDEVKMQNQKDL